MVIAKVVQGAAYLGGLSMQPPVPRARLCFALLLLLRLRIYGVQQRLQLVRLKDAVLHLREGGSGCSRLCGWLSNTGGQQMYGTAWRA